MWSRRSALFATLGLAAALGCVWQYVRIRSERSQVLQFRAEVAARVVALRRAEESQAPSPAPGAEAVATTTDDPVLLELSRAVENCLQQVEGLKNWFNGNPAARIPEMQYLSEHDWIEQSAQAEARGDQKMRETAARIRNVALHRFAATQLKPALEAYAAAHGGVLPADLKELESLLPDPGAAAILRRYELLIRGPTTTAAARNRAIGVRAEAIVDPDFDHAFYIGSTGTPVTIVPSATDSNAPLLDIALGRAQAAYANSHNGELVQDVERLAPYFTSRADAQKALERQDRLDDEVMRQTAVILPPNGSERTRSR